MMQVMSHTRSGERRAKRWAKRQAHRLLRRLAKLDPENAPLKYAYHGWWD